MQKTRLSHNLTFHHTIKEKLVKIHKDPSSIAQEYKAGRRLESYSIEGKLLIGYRVNDKVLGIGGSGIYLHEI